MIQMIVLISDGCPPDFIFNLCFNCQLQYPMLLANAVHEQVLSSPILSAAQTTSGTEHVQYFVFENSEFESEAGPRYLTRVQLYA